MSASIITRIIQNLEGSREDFAGGASERAEALRRDLSTLADAVAGYGNHRFEDVRRSAGELAREVQRHLPAVAEQVSRNARFAGRAVRRDPVPTIVALGTVALVASLLLRRNQR